MKKALLTKEEIAREISDNPKEPLSVRSVERYIKLAKVKPAKGHEGSGRGRVAKFHREDVEKIVAAYSTDATARELHKRFARQRDKGEWFNLVASDVETIKAIHSA